MPSKVTNTQTRTDLAAGPSQQQRSRVGWGCPRLLKRMIPTCNRQLASEGAGARGSSAGHPAPVLNGHPSQTQPPFLATSEVLTPGVLRLPHMTSQQKTLPCAQPAPCTDTAREGKAI